MFESITSLTILAEAKTWAGEFDNLVLVAVGLGIGFAIVRFAKGLFF